MNDDVSFTGERLHGGDPRFRVDLARHQAAYQLARAHGGTGRILDLGCGSGHGTALLAESHARVVGLDRVRPDRGSLGRAHFVRADLDGGLPFAPGCFELVVSFQVIEHLEDPTRYLDAIARLLARDGVALLTTPNLLTSDGVNPYHVHEYRAAELADRLRTRFEEVEVHGIGASAPVRALLAARSRRIRRILRLDPLKLRERLPRAWIERLFALFARLVRRPARRDAGSSDVSWRDFPLGGADDACLDLFAICRRPR